MSQARAPQIKQDNDHRGYSIFPRPFFFRVGSGYARRRGGHSLTKNAECLCESLIDGHDNIKNERDGMLG